VHLFRGTTQIYTIARSISTGLSLVFALIYTRDLGLTNRGNLAAIMSISILILAIFTSGTTLTLRNQTSEKKVVANLPGFFSLTLLELCFGGVIFFASLSIFTALKSEIALNLILSSVIYFVASGLHLISLELLIAFKRFTVVAILEILTILLQITAFFTFGWLTTFSTAICLLSSFIVSAILISAIAASIWWGEIDQHIRLSDPRPFLRTTKGNHAIGATLSIIDRLDRLVILWFLPIQLLAKYAVMSSFFSYFRFFPDSLSKLLIAGKLVSIASLRKTKLRVFFIFTIVSVFMISVYHFSVALLLGTIWLLPWQIPVLFAIQELLRSTFQVSGMQAISKRTSLVAHRASTGLILISLPITAISTHLLGMHGVPIGFILSYSLALIFMYALRKN
jgi:O-antigen/teichoic acid export membrane protein